MRVTWNTDVEGTAAEVAFLIAQGPDGEAHQDRPEGARRVAEMRYRAQAAERRLAESAAAGDDERRRYLALAQTVLDGLRAIFGIATSETGGPMAPREALLVEARRMAQAIGEGDLVAKMTDVLAQYGDHPLAEEYRFDVAPERLARAILRRQIGVRETHVGWAERGSGSRVNRVRTAETILRTSELLARTENTRPGTEGWLEAIGGAIASDQGHQGLSALEAGRIALHALGALTSGELRASDAPRPDDTGQPDARAPRVEAGRTAEEA